MLDCCLPGQKRKYRLYFQSLVEDYGTILVTFNISVYFCGMSFPALLAMHFTWIPYYMKLLETAKLSRS
jgi:hypothetical protein